MQTSSLDGEKNLKKKRVAKNFEKLVNPGGDFHPGKLLVTAQVEAEGPNGNLYSFNGNMYVNRKKYFPLSHE